MLAIFVAPLIDTMFQILVFKPNILLLLLLCEKGAWSKTGFVLNCILMDCSMKWAPIRTVFGEHICSQLHNGENNRRIIYASHTSCRHTFECITSILGVAIL